MKLPPLPKPDMVHRKAIDDCDEELSYSAEVMAAYAKQAVAAERERCIAAIKKVGPSEGTLALVTQGFIDAIMEGQ